MKHLLLTLTLVISTAAFASGSDGRPCAGPACSARKTADFEREVNRLQGRHRENTALQDLTAQLGRAAEAKPKGDVLVKFFGLRASMDNAEVEKAFDARLNDGQSDKVSNVEVRRLLDVFVGTAE